RAGQIEAFARAVAARLDDKLKSLNALPVAHSVPEKWLDALVRDLRAHPGASIVLAGDQQPASVHALAHAMNHALGNAGRTVIYTDPVEAQPVDQSASLAELVQDMERGRVDVLVILGGNPVFTARADLYFSTHLTQV